MWIKILQLIASLSVLVIVHELGHFIFARLFKCRVEKFYLFFNPWFSIFKFKWGETTYGLGWIPLGGYVKISGMIDESMDTEAMKQPAQPWEFRSKPAWQRLLMMTGGVLMNVIFAALIYIGISFHYGDSYIAAKDAVYGFEFSPLAQEIGFRNGDKVLNIDGEPLDNYAALPKKIVLDEARYVEVEREGEIVRVEIGEGVIPRILKDKGFITPRIPFVIAGVEAGSNAAKAGLAAGDAVVGINGTTGYYYADVIKALGGAISSSIVMEVERDSAGVKQIISIPVEVSAEGKVGVMLVSGDEFIKVSTKEYGVLSSIPAGIKRAGNEISDYWKQLKMMVNPDTEAYKHVGGVIAIGNLFPDTWSWFSFLNITAILSIMLAVLNILPIPALDGGHVLFLAFEVVTGRRPSDKFLERAQIVGLLLLFALLIYANGNDIFKLVSKWLGA